MNKSSRSYEHRLSDDSRASCIICIYKYKYTQKQEHFFPFISACGKGVNIDLLCYYRCTFCHLHCRHCQHRLGGGMNPVQPIWLSASMTHHVRQRPPPSASLARGRPPVRPRNRSGNIYLSQHRWLNALDLYYFYIFFSHRR